MLRSPPCRSFPGSARIGWFLASAVLAVSYASSPDSLQAADGQQVTVASRRCVVVEAYVRRDDASTSTMLAALREFCAGRPGVMLVVREIDGNATNQQRLEQIARYYRSSTTGTPAIYVCNRLITGQADAAAYVSQVRRALQVDVFVRSGCPRCRRAKEYLATFQSRYPGLDVVQRDVAQDYRASAYLQALVRAHRTAAASVPVFHLCDRLLIGFDSPGTSGARLDELLNRWTIPCPADSSAHTPQHARAEPMSGRFWLAIPRLPAEWMLPVSRSVAFTGLLLTSQDPGDVATPPPDAPVSREEPTGLDVQLPLPGEPPESAYRSGPAGELLPVPAEMVCPESDKSGLVRVPLWGELDVRIVGLPMFTIAIGLVDGFNPCAMWVLAFLLSVLVNLHDRRKMLLVAGTFVVISAAAYYAFMAAWLNVFLLVGYLRPIQILLGVLALVVGAVHIKDFFAFHRGITFSIPESAKPGIYARVRGIVTAEHLFGALIGASVLALLVNTVELLCTAGLPALYTEVLTMQRLPAWQYYGYLALYNLAYMFDDLCLVATMVATLSRARLQEVHGRWLKLISGLVILALGAVMIFAPDRLV